MKAAAYLVVDTAGRHPVQGEFRHLQSLGRACSAVIPEQELQRRWLRELRLESEAAGPVVELAGKALEGRLKNAVGERLYRGLTSGESLGYALYELLSAG